MFPRPRLVSIALLLVAALPAGAQGQCQCERPELLVAYLESALVFQASVGPVRKVHPGEGLELSLELGRIWKGEPGPDLSVWMSRGAVVEGCQQVPMPGVAYLFLVGAESPLRPNGCAGNLAIALEELPRGWEEFLEAVGKGDARRLEPPD